MELHMNFSFRVKPSGVLVVLSIIGFTACGLMHGSLSNPNSNRSEDPRFNEFERFIDNILLASDTPGVAVSILENGRISYVKGFGVKKKGSPEPILPQTLFDVQSVTKSFTGAVAMMLVQEGKLDMNAPVTRYAPDFKLRDPHAADAITVHQIFTHTAGLASDPADLDMNHLPFDDTKPDGLMQFFHSFQNESLLVTPGDLHLYSNFGYSLAGLIIEGADGINYSESVTQRVLDPLGMNGATFDRKVARTRDYAWDHSVDESGALVAEDPTEGSESFFTRPRGGLFASVGDLSKFAEMLLREDAGLINPEQLQIMTKALVSKGTCYQGYGYGFHIEIGAFSVNCNEEDRLVKAVGDGRGVTTRIVVDPESRFGIVLAANGDSLNTKAIIDKAFHLFANKVRVPHPDKSLDPRTWSSYAGDYVDPNNFGRVTVSIGQEKLYISFPDAGSPGSNQPIELKAAGNDFFFFVPPNEFLTPAMLAQRNLLEGRFAGQFIRNQAGNVHYFSTLIGIAARK
jgi:CubicO group peptidase (beta-lactamase class C family)